MGYLARLVRTSMLEVLNERYITAARAQGISDRVVVYKYALRNAVIPTIAILGGRPRPAAWAGRSSSR